jgi:hypothetical protein
VKTYLITLGVALPVAILAAGFDLVSATVATAVYIALIAAVGAASVVNIEAAQRTGS